MSTWVIERLTEKHERAEFACGNQSLDTFLHKLVGQYEKRRLGWTFVATESASSRVASYYTIAAGALDVNTLPKVLRKKLPKHPVPTIHLGRLAVDSTFKGRRLGEVLLLHALKAAYDLSEKVGAFGVDVHAIDEQAVAFYTKYGFVALEDRSSQLLLPMKTVASLLD